MDFHIHQKDEAPEPSHALLAQVERKFGFVPNLLGVLAESPAALEAYMSILAAFDKSDLKPVERQVVLLAASVENQCTYCVAVHSMAAKMSGGSDALIEAVRSGTTLPDGRTQALRDFARTVVRERGWVSAQDVARFRDAGFAQRHVLEVLIGVSLKTLSNYTNHIAHTPLDDAFRPFAPAGATEERPIDQQCCAA